MNTLYLECGSGISGDMTVAALLDLGADKAVLERALSGIKEEGFSIEISRVKKSGIDCCDFNVVLDSEHENHDHDMEYLYGSGHEHCDDGHGHAEHKHTENVQHHHVHRNLDDVTRIIEPLDITDRARELALRIFSILAEAEAKAHNRKINEVHFHEVGAIDSIVDIVSIAVCFDTLDSGDVVIPKIVEGTGTVRCQHGILPVPVPAVLNIAEKYGLPLSVTDRTGEYVTPTGAAFCAAVMTTDKLPEVFVPKKTGLGAGKREHELPGILRAILI